MRFLRQKLDGVAQRRGGRDGDDIATLLLENMSDLHGEALL